MSSNPTPSAAPLDLDALLDAFEKAIRSEERRDQPGANYYEVRPYIERVAEARAALVAAAQPGYDQPTDASAASEPSDWICMHCGTAYQGPRCPACKRCWSLKEDDLRAMYAPASAPAATPLDLDAPLAELDDRLRKHMDAAKAHDLDPLDGCIVVRARPLAALVAAATAEPEDDHDEAETLGFVRDTIMRAKYRLEFEELSPEVKRGLRRIIAEGERAQAFVTAQATELAALREDAERWRFVREHYTWLRRVDDDEVEQTYLEVRMPIAANLSCAPMADHAIDRLRAALAPHQTTGDEHG